MTYNGFERRSLSPMSDGWINILPAKMTWSQNFNMLQHFMTTTMCDSSETLVCLKMRYPTAIDKSPGIERWEYLIFRQTHILNCRPWRDFPARWMKRPSSMMVWKRWRSTLRIAHGAFPWRLGSSWTEMEPVIPEGTFAYKCAKDEDVCWWFSEGKLYMFYIYASLPEIKKQQDIHIRI